MTTTSSFWSKPTTDIPVALSLVVSALLMSASLQGSGWSMTPPIVDQIESKGPRGARGRPAVWHCAAVLLGLVHVNLDSMSRPDSLVDAVRMAEAAGFDSAWAGEHIVLPDPRVPPSPMGRQDPALDSLLALTWAAAHTTTIRLATGIVILPQRNPVVLAKEVATLDVLSGG